MTKPQRRGHVSSVKGPRPKQRRKTKEKSKETTITKVPDGRDPTTKKVQEAEFVSQVWGKFNGKCAECGRQIYPGHAVMCSICNVILHQFHADTHTTKNHRPEFTVLSVDWANDSIKDHAPGSEMRWMKI